MFDEQPSYLGGLTTQLQDSMNGIQYGRSDVNQREYVPNDVATSRVYEKMPQQKLPQRDTKPQGSQALDTIQKHVVSLEKSSHPVEFYGLQMPSKLVESTPDVQQWIRSLMNLTQVIGRNTPLIEALKRPDLSVGILSLEFTNPGVFQMDGPSQIQRAQDLIRHLRKQSTQPSKAPSLPVNDSPLPNAPVMDKAPQNGPSPYQAMVDYAMKNSNGSFTYVGMFRLPVAWLNGPMSQMLTEKNLVQGVARYQQLVSQGIVPEQKLIEMIVPTLIWTTGMGADRNDIKTTLPLANMVMQKLQASNAVPNAQANVMPNVAPSNAPANAQANALLNVPDPLVAPVHQKDEGFFSTTTGKVVVGAGLIGLLYSLRK